MKGKNQGAPASLTLCPSYQMVGGGSSHYRSTPGEKRRNETHTVSPLHDPQWSDGHRDDQHSCWHHSKKDKQCTHACCHLWSILAPRIVPGSVYLPIQGQGVAGGRRESTLHATVGFDQSGSDSKKLHITSNPDLFYECILRKKINKWRGSL